jgi:phosphatidylserine/phosphatidylglycerophosphate/cardiolipin synthase-like enzyme
MRHTKLIPVADLVCCTGSPNMNYRSKSKDEECCVIAMDPALAATLAAELENDRTDAEKLEYSAWSKRGGLPEQREQLARVPIEQLRPAACASCTVVKPS